MWPPEETGGALAGKHSHRHFPNGARKVRRCSDSFCSDIEIVRLILFVSPVQKASFQ
jgi:hypothetical protein